MGNAHETFSAGRLICKNKAPYFRSVLLGLVPIELPGLGTVGVSEHGVLVWDPEFVSQITPEQMAGVFCHEILHVVLKHSVRCRRAGRDPEIDNMATDLAINPTVREMGFQLPEGDKQGLFPEKFGFKSGLTADEYYELLIKKFPPKPQPQPGNGDDQESEEGEGACEAAGDGSDDGEDGEGEGGGGKDADHSKPAKGQPKPHNGPGPDKPTVGAGWCGSCANRPVPGEPKKEGKQAKELNRTEAELDRMARQVAEAVREHAQKNRGTVPAGLARWADQALEPSKIPWEKQLARITRMAVAWRPGAVDYRYDSPGRRQGGIGYGPGKPIMPRMRQPVPLVMVIADTSGSMGANELAAAVRETNAILKATGADIVFAVCDAAVHGLKKVKSFQEIAGLLRGGGGTDMRPAFAEALKLRPRPEVIVCITDGMVGDGVPEKAPPGVKVIFVGVGPYRMRPCNWGEYIECDNVPKASDAA